MKKPQNGETFQLRPRPAETVSLAISAETLASLEKVAAGRDMSVQALLKFYIGQGLRHDLTQLFSNQMLETTAEVLARHIPSEEERKMILREIQGQAAV